MRRNRTTTPFVGQLLFAEINPGSIVLDCVLARTEAAGSAATPVTLKAAWPTNTDAAEVTAVLRQWADVEADIDVSILDGPRGPAVEITSSNTKVILTPEE